MMPNIDPKAMKKMMDRMGIKSGEIAAERVVIECSDRNIVIMNPSVMSIEMNGNTSFQISGSISEEAKEKEKIEISGEDVDMVKEKTGIDDEERIRAALEATNGDIAEAIIKLKGE